VNVLFWVVQVVKEVEDRVSFDEDILVHQINSLACLVVVNCPEHLEPVVVHHLYVVHCLYIVRNAIVHYPRVFNYLLEVNVILVALLLIEPAMIVIAAQVIELIDVKGIALVGDNFKHPLAPFVHVF